MNIKIISDSSANMTGLTQVPFASVPLHIIVDNQNFVDDPSTDLQAVDHALAHCKSSSTACPAIGDWLEAFGEAENIFCVTITSSLSGCYSSAQMAKDDYEEHYPDRHVYLIDSLSVGPEMMLIVEKLQELILQGMSAPDIYREIQEYTKHTHLLFSLESLRNMAKNGRVNPAVAKLAGVLGIRVVGQASMEGELEVLAKCRGEKRALSSIIKTMKEKGYQGGKVRIAHNQNEKAALQLKAMIQDDFSSADVQLHTTGALCSYYAEKGGLLLGFAH